MIEEEMEGHVKRRITTNARTNGRTQPRDSKSKLYGISRNIEIHT